jgi:CheY-like chemotaxis protein
MKDTVRFILVDDDLCALTMATKIIRNNCRRAEIIPFSECKEAIKFMEAEDFIVKQTDTVLLTDLHMPEMDGFALLDRMENRFIAMKDRLHVFVLSAEACSAEIRRVLGYKSVIGFLSKPFSDTKIQQIIDCIQFPL